MKKIFFIVWNFFIFFALIFLVLFFIIYVYNNNERIKDLYEHWTNEKNAQKMKKMIREIKTMIKKVIMVF